MKLAIVNNQAPYIRGGAEQLAEWLADALRERGHEAEIVRIPFAWREPDEVLSSMLAARLIRVPNVDRVIGLKFPAYYVPHEDKVLWLLHQFRQAHELWGTPHSGLRQDRAGRRVRDAVRIADSEYLTEARRIYTNSAVVGERLSRSTGLASEVLFPPLRDPESYYCDGYEPFVFYPSRLSAFKRQHLAVEAMAWVPGGVRLIVAGAADTAEEEARLRDIVRRRSLEDRVELRVGWMDEQEKRDLMARACAVLYLPYDEDSYGYVSLEAIHSGKPVITCSDSGGTDAVVIDGKTGWVTDPDPASIARAIAEAAGDVEEARRRGEAAQEHLRTLRLDWDHVVECLTS